MNASPIAATASPASLPLLGGAVSAASAEKTDFHLVLHQANATANSPSASENPGVREVVDASHQLRRSGDIADSSPQTAKASTRSASERTFSVIAHGSESSAKQLKLNTANVLPNPQSKKTRAANLAKSKQASARLAGEPPTELARVTVHAPSNPSLDELVDLTAAPTPSAAESSSMQATLPIATSSTREFASAVLPFHFTASSAKATTSPAITPLPTADSHCALSGADALIALPSGSSTAVLSACVPELKLATASTSPTKSAVPTPPAAAKAKANAQPSAAREKTNSASASSAPSYLSPSNPSQRVFSIHPQVPWGATTGGAPEPSRSTLHGGANVASAQTAHSSHAPSDSTPERGNQAAAPEKTADTITAVERDSNAAATSGFSVHPALVISPAPAQSTATPLPTAALSQTMPSVAAVVVQASQTSSLSASPAQPPAQSSPTPELPPAVASAQLHVSGSNSELKISVQLPELGKVEVRAVTAHEVTTAHITAFRHEGLQALTSDRGGLEQLLKSRDVILGSLDSHAQGHSAGQQRQQGSHSPAHSSGGATRAAATASTTAEADHSSFLPDHTSISVRA